MSTTIHIPKLAEKLDLETAVVFVYDCFTTQCCEDTAEVVASLIKFLEWANFDSALRTPRSEKKVGYRELYGDPGVFYMIHTLADRAGLMEHGTSCRCSWLSGDGTRLLEELKKHTPEQIEGKIGSLGI